MHYVKPIREDLREPWTAAVPVITRGLIAQCLVFNDRGLLACHPG
jgi:hypothetical protein